MRRLCFTLVCMLALGLAVPVSPALSKRAPKLHIADFEMAVPAKAVAARGAGYRSRVLRAPRRFDLVGMRWRGRLEPRIWVRARRRHRHWTPWTRVAADPDDAPDRGDRERSPQGFSAPVWTGDADFVQYRMSRRVPRLRLHFVRVPRVTRRALASRSATASRKAAGEPGTQPAIQPRSAWGADACPPRTTPEYGEVQAALVHHTVTANDYTQAEVPSIILSMCRYHRNSNGWNDLGYNFVVDKYGGIWEGRAGGIDQPVVGAQAQGYNSQTTGIADIGTHQDVPEGDAGLNALASLIRWKLPLHGTPTQGTVTLTSGGGSLNRYEAGTPVTMERISGHRDGDATECPGDALYAQLPDLRARVGNVQPVEPVQARTRIEATLTPRRIVYPDQTTISGVLRQINGEPIAGAPVDVQTFGSSGWRSTWHATTGFDGGFRVDATARLTHKVRVSFAGDAGRLPSLSPEMTMTVVPELRLQRSLSHQAVGDTVELSGTVQPSKTRLVLVVERRSGGERRRGRLKLRARGGRFSRTYRLHRAALYRFFVRSPRDERNGGSKSSAVYVRALPPSQVEPTPGGGGREPDTTGGGGVSPSGGTTAR